MSGLNIKSIHQVRQKVNYFAVHCTVGGYKKMDTGKLTLVASYNSLSRSLCLSFRFHCLHQATILPCKWSLLLCFILHLRLSWFFSLSFFLPVPRGAVKLLARSLVSHRSLVLECGNKSNRQIDQCHLHFLVRFLLSSSLQCKFLDASIRSDSSIFRLDSNHIRETFWRRRREKNV